METQTSERTVEDLSDRELLVAIYEMVTKQQTVLERFLPLLEKYERASQANGMFAARRAMKGA